MMANFRLILIAASLSVLTGCSATMLETKTEGARAFTIKVLTPGEKATQTSETGSQAGEAAPGTKTSVGENWSVSWSSGDALAAVINSTDATFTYSGDDTFTTSSWTPAEGTEYEWKLLYHPSHKQYFTASKIGTGEYTSSYFALPISGTQASPGDKSHLGGQPLAGYATSTGTEQPSIEMKHLTTVFAVQVTNSTSKAINIASVSVENDASAAMSGSFNLNPEEGLVQGVSGKTNAYSSVSVSNGVISAGTTGEFYVPSAPFSLSSGSTLTVRLTDSDGGTASFSKVCSAPVSFNAGGYRTRAVTISEGDITEARYYSKITSTDELTDGEYLIVCEAKNVALNGALSTLDASGNYKAVTITDGKILSTDDVDAISFTYSLAAKTLQSRSGYYIGRAASSNGLDSSTSSAYANTITFDSKGNAIIAGSGGPALQIYTASGDMRFRYYKSSQTPVQLYKLHSGTVEPAKDVQLSISYDAEKISQNGVTLWCTVEGNDAATPSAAAFEYGRTSALGGSAAADISGAYFWKYLDALRAGTTYYVRAYAIVDGHKYYSDTVSFKTEEGSGEVVSGAEFAYSLCCEFPAVDVSEGALTTSGSSSAYGDKWYNTPTNSSTQMVVTHTFENGGALNRTYSLLFDTTKRCALWVACAFNSTTWGDKDVGRQEKWGYDPAISESLQPCLTNTYNAYNGNSFSRGHQVASGDRQTTVSEDNQTFYYSNMTPQNQTLNGGNWMQLESAVQSYGNSVSGLDTLYMVTGPIFDEGYVSTTDKAGNACAIPSRYYKCLMRCTFDESGEVTAAKGVAYLTTGNNAAANTAYSGWTTTIDAVEELTGFNFFASVPEDIQSQAESTSASIF